jgi:hypothetical protein
MSFAIDLDRKHRGRTIEIEDIVTRRMLLAETQPGLIPTQR